MRNYQLYGSFLANRAITDNVQRLTDGIDHPVGSYVQVLFQIVPRQLFQSIWYDGGDNQLQLPTWFNASLAVFAGLSVLACMWALLGNRPHLAARFVGLQTKGILGFMIGALIACILNARYSAYVEGRIAYVGLPAFAIVVVSGAGWAAMRIGRRLALLGMLAWPVVLILADAYVLMNFVIPLRGL